jgi:hypothetical protein
MHAITVPSGREGYLFEDTKKGTVWIDVGNLQAGIDNGNVVYGIVEGYAHNTGKKFIGDPMGLSPTGFYRRKHDFFRFALRHHQPSFPA